MTEILGAVVTLGSFFLAGAFVNHAEWRKEQRRAQEQAEIEANIEFMAQYTEWAIQQEIQASNTRFAEARQHITPAFKY